MIASFPLSKARRLTVGLLATAILFAGCSGSDSGGETQAPTTDPGSTTTTTAAPQLLGLTADLDLAPQQCWAELPAPSETTTTIASEDTQTTIIDDSPAEPLPASSTTLPKPDIIALVDCAGTHVGQAFASFCLGPVDDATPTEHDATTTTLTDSLDLVEVPCSAGSSSLEWPGDRIIRRAAARICLQRFETSFNETYALSELVAREFTPTEGVWDQGERRVVCTVNALKPETTTEPEG